MTARTELVGESLQLLTIVAFLAAVALGILGRIALAIVAHLTLFGGTIALVLVSVEWNDKPYIAVSAGLVYGLSLVPLLVHLGVLNVAPWMSERFETDEPPDAVIVPDWRNAGIDDDDRFRNG